MAKPKPSRESKITSLLARDENDTVFNIMGPKCQSLATAVIQLFLTDKPQHNKWIKKICGVACFVKDNSKRSYFIRVFNLDERKLEWEQELYTQFKYKTPRPFFHMFEAEGCIAGVSFADDQEATSFQSAIQDRLRNKEQRSARKQMAHTETPSSGFTTYTDQPSIGITDTPSTQQSESYGKLFNTLIKNKKNKKSKKFTKADISDPTNFQHVSHMGWNPAKGLDGFQNDTQDENINTLFKMVGITDKQLQDEDTRAFIYDFIDSQGFRETLQNLPTEESAPPPVPARQMAVPSPVPTPMATRHPPPAPPAPPARVIVPPPPPVAPSQANKPKISPTANRQMAAPPPPPPSRNFPPPQPRSIPPAPQAPPVPCGGGAPAPPPPPPPPPMMMPMDNIQSEPKQLTPAAPVQADGRSALLADIRSGLNLKRVQREDPAEKPANSRNELLGQIRHGIELRPVSDTPRPSSQPQGVLDGMAMALAKALADRSRAIHSSDDSGDDGDDDDDDEEWDD